MRSTGNGETWDNATSGTTLHLYGVTYGHNTFVAVGKLGNLRSSSDGATWTHRTKPKDEDLMGANCLNNTFVAVGASGKILRSTDNASTWSSVTSPITTDLNGVTFSE